MSTAPPVVVIGAARGIGRAIAADVAAQLWVSELVAADCQVGQAEEVAAELAAGGKAVTAVAVAVALSDGVSIEQLVNKGETLQDSNTSQLIFGLREIVAFVSEAITLVPGDLILTGTPHGVGAFRDPPIWLRPGDEITVEVDGGGSITNPVARA